MAADLPYKRKQYLVDRAYQLRYVTRVFTIVFVIAIFTWLACLALLRTNMYRPELEQQQLYIVSLIAVTTALLVELLIAIPIVFFLGIRQSHRVVGPLNRIKQILQAIGAGDFSQRITVRQGDALEDLAKWINQMSDSLQQRFTKPPG